MRAQLTTTHAFGRWMCASAGALALLALSGCLQNTPAPSAATPVPSTPTSEPTTDPSKVTMNVLLTPGPGPFFMPSPTVGLDKLTAYHATLIVSFTGTRAGKPEKWSKSYSMRVVSQPAARQLTIASITQPDEEIPDTPPQTEVGGIQYEGGDNVACAATVVGPDVPSLTESEPANLLPSVLGADEAGNATVNEVATRHYEFDERALVLGDSAPYSGELWVAADGDYLVRYMLSSKAGPEAYGEGLEGTTSWEYNLTDVNKPAAIHVPNGCPPGQLEASEMPGATNVQKSVGTLTFDLPSATIDDVLAFYSAELTGDGWAATAEPIVEPGKMGSAAFTKGDLKVSVVVWAADGATSVSVSLGNAAAEKIE